MFKFSRLKLKFGPRKQFKFHKISDVVSRKAINDKQIIDGIRLNSVEKRNMIKHNELPIRPNARKQNGMYEITISIKRTV